MLTSDVDWEQATHEVIARGWTRIPNAVGRSSLDDLEAAAPNTWTALPATEGDAGVQQAGLACHCAITGGGGAVDRFAAELVDAMSANQLPDTAVLPPFNHAQWCAADNGEKFITAHRDPDTAGGVVAVLTIRGAARFRIWDLDCSLAQAKADPQRSTEWWTADGDLVVMQCGGWPRPDARCPIHEVESPPVGDRLTLTLRHNKGGFDAPYFAS